MKKLVKVLSLVLLCAFAFVLTACAPKDGAAAKEKMEADGYTVILVESGEDEDTDVVCTVTATRGLIGSILGDTEAEGLIATLYKTSSAATEAYEDLQSDDKDEEYENLKQIGKWVVIASDDALKTFKK